MADAAVLAEVLVRAGDLVVVAGSDGWPARPTPCPGFDVAGLAAHMVAGLDLLGHGDDPAEEAMSTSERFERAARRAAVLDDSSPVVGRVIVEYVAHGWDLAVATGRAVPFTDAQAATALRLAPAVLAGERRGRSHRYASAVPVPRSAPPLAQFVGLTGRRPGGEL